MTFAPTSPRASSKLEVYKRVPWRQHVNMLRRGPVTAGRWEQGDHLLIAGPTKSGKTTVMSDVVKLRARVVVFVSKIKDPTFEKEFPGWTILHEWPKGGPKPWETHILLWPEAVKDNPDGTLMRQRHVFRHAMNKIFTTGNWCVVVDEAIMFADPKFIGLGAQLGHMHYYGRSSGISMVTLAQRPSWIPRVILSSVTHAFIARTRDKDDQKRLADLGGIDPREVAANLWNLPTRHDYLYLNPQGDAVPVIVNTRQ